MYRLVIFDLDGTILDTIADLADALNHTLAQNSFPEKTLEETRSMVGRGLRNLVKDASCTSDGEMIDKLHSEMVSYYSEHSAVKTAPYPGITDMLKELRSRGIRIAVLSNKRDSVTAFLCSRFFPGLLDAVRGETPGIPMKPSPEPVLSLIDKIGVPADETVYVGDSEVDITTSRNAGIDCLTVTWGFRDRTDLEKAGADRLFDDVGSLLDAITAS